MNAIHGEEEIDGRANERTGTHIYATATTITNNSDRNDNKIHYLSIHTNRSGYEKHEHLFILWTGSEFRPLFALACTGTHAQTSRFAINGLQFISFFNSTSFFCSIFHCSLSLFPFPFNLCVWTLLFFPSLIPFGVSAPLQYLISMFGVQFALSLVRGTFVVCMFKRGAARVSNALWAARLLLNVQCIDLSMDVISNKGIAVNMHWSISFWLTGPLLAY